MISASAPQPAYKGYRRTPKDRELAKKTFVPIFRKKLLRNNSDLFSDNFTENVFTALDQGSKETNRKYFAIFQKF